MIRPRKFTWSPQKGQKGHCFMAQVWDENDHNLACIEDTEDPDEASAIARLFAASPMLLYGCRNIVKVLRESAYEQFKPEILALEAIIVIATNEKPQQ